MRTGWFDDENYPPGTKAAWSILILVCVLVVVTCFFCLGCDAQRRVEVTIIDIYRDGFGFRAVVSVLEMPDGSRQQARGKFGKKGERTLVWVRGGHISLTEQ